MNPKHLAEPELAAVKLEGGLTRSAFLVRGTLAAGAAYGLGAVSPFVSRSLAQGGGDVDVVNYALTLEYLEAAFYQQAAKKVAGLSSDQKKLIKEIGENEQEHVDALIATAKKLGGTPAKKPRVDFAGAFNDKATFLKVANVLEDTGVSAYNGAAPSIKSKDLLATAGAIVQVEARHAAAIRLQNSAPPAPEAFDPSLSQSQVLKAVQPFIKS